MSSCANLPTGWTQTFLPCTTSTMTVMKQAEWRHRPEEIALLTTDFQTLGHGQQGTVWEAAQGENLLLGIVLHPREVLAREQFYLSEIAALAVAEALGQWADGFCVKWPNDVYWHDQKVSGMLLEHDLLGRVIDTTVVGIGVNINQTHFESDAPNPVSLRTIVGERVSRSAVLTALVQRFDALYRLLQAGGAAQLHQRYRQHLYRGEGWHTFADVGGAFEARIVDVSPLGLLCLQRRDGRLQDYAFKAVRYVL